MVAFQIILWLVFLFALTGYLVTGRRQMEWARVAWACIGSPVGGYILFKLIRGPNVDFVLQVLPLSLQLLLVAMAFFIADAVLRQPGGRRDWFAHAGYFWILLGAVRIGGVILKDYHWLQAVDGVWICLLGAAYVFAARQPLGAVKFFQVTAVGLVLYLFAVIVLDITFLARSPDLQGVADSLMRYPNHFALLWFYIHLNLEHHALVSGDVGRTLSRIQVGLAVGTLTVVHPEVHRFVTEWPISARLAVLGAFVVPLPVALAGLLFVQRSKDNTELRS